MKLEEQVVSLELAGKMDKVGFKQESMWYWGRADECKPYDDWKLFNLAENDNKKYPYTYTERHPAFTVAELGEMLPDRTRNTAKDKVLYPYDFVEWPHPCPMHKWKGWIYKANGQTIHRSMTFGETEANARAKMLIYLKEKGLLQNGK